MAETTPKIFFLLKDPAWNNLKPNKIHLFSKTYLTDGSDKLITDVSNEGLEYMRKGMVYDEEFPFFYWTFSPKGSFIDTFVTSDLLSDARAWADFRLWLEQIVTAWCNANKLPFEIKRDKEHEYYIKFFITVTPTPITSET